MGSKSYWPVMKEASLILEELAVPYEKKIVSAHRTPDWLLVTPAPQFRALHFGCMLYFPVLTINPGSLWFSF
jgi:hypothetical protein